MNKDSRMKRFLNNFLIRTIFGIFALNATAQTWLTNGLVGYYPFNNNANDESGLGKNGVVQGAVLTTDRRLNQRITTMGENGLPVGTNDFSMTILAAC
ncbi:MAG: hypothetical protein ABJC04_07665 [Verrucomicrobiota bacterium]